jgi:predicted permease
MRFEQWTHDLRMAWRGLYRAKGFATTAVLTLAVGIAGTTVMFALVQGVLLHPLAVRDQDRLLVAWNELRSSGAQHWPFRVHPSEIARIGDTSQVFERAAGVGYNGAIRFVGIENGVASYISGSFVTGDFFSVLGVEPMLGRAFTRASDVMGAPPEMVITHGLWQRRYGGSPDVIGRRILVDERAFTIIGVMPPDVEYPRGVEAWRPAGTFPARWTNEKFQLDLDLVARLRPGATLAQAATELQGVLTRFEAEATVGPRPPRGLTPVVRSYEEVVVGDVRTAMLLLFAAVGLVLLIASANVANLLLMRGEARRPELAVRAALGAGRGSLARQVLAESLVLAVASGLCGLGVTWLALQALMAWVPDGLPRVESVRIDLGVILFTIAVAFISAALAGLAPALSSARLDLVAQLRGGGRGVSGSARHGRRALVVAQIALAVTVVAAAGLMTRSLLRLQSADMGLEADRLVFVELSLPEAKYAAEGRHLQFLNDVVAELEAVPAVAGATPVHSPPFAGTGGWDVPRFTAEGQSAERALSNPALNLESIHPNYFKTFGVTIVRGRGFTAADRKGAPNAAILSEDAAARTWPGEDPIGKRLKMGGLDSPAEWRTVVGIARPTRYRELVEPRATLYVPAEQFRASAQMLVLRTAAPLSLVAGLARERVAAVDPDVQVMRVAPFSEMLDRPLAKPRFNAFLLTIFGSAALLLAAIGLYAVMGAYVRQRDTEIGVRVALGATARDVRSLVLGEGLWLAGLGAAIGIATALAVTRLLRGLLFGVDPLDPVTMLAAAILLVSVSAVASYLPARRAMRVDPIAMLRGD